MFKIVSLGGSIINPGKIDVNYLIDLKNIIFNWIKKDNTRKIILITGGGKIAREYQETYKKINNKDCNSFDLDMLGIIATKLNAALIQIIMKPLCLDEVATDPTQNLSFKGNILISSGWKPGFSTDYVATKFAERYNVDEIINLTNVKQIYDRNPNKSKQAKPLSKLRWDEFENIIGNEWEPGLNLPFDPIAIKLAKTLKLTLYVADGYDLTNFEKILNKQDDFLGSIVL